MNWKQRLMAYNLTDEQRKTVLDRLPVTQLGPCIRKLHPANTLSRQARRREQFLMAQAVVARQHPGLSRKERRVKAREMSVPHTLAMRPRNGGPRG